MSAQPPYRLALDYTRRESAVPNPRNCVQLLSPVTTHQASNKLFAIAMKCVIGNSGAVMHVPEALLTTYNAFHSDAAPSLLQKTAILDARVSFFPIVCTRLALESVCSDAPCNISSSRHREE